MGKIHLLVVLCLMLVASLAQAQGVQNMDIYWLFGVQSVKSQTIAGTSVTVPGSTGATLELGYGYQIVRKSAASLWVELFSMFGGGGHAVAPGIAGTFSSGWGAWVLPGLRFMVPLQSRVSLYAASGGGVGFFDTPTIQQQPFPQASSNTTYHGVFDFGGGVDIRLNRLVSIRGEVRDYVSATRLGGVNGRNRLQLSAGLAMHF